MSSTSCRMSATDQFHRPRTDFLSIMSFVSPSSHDKSNDNDVTSPLVSPATSASSNCSLSPIGMKCPPMTPEDRERTSKASPGSPVTSPQGFVRNNHVSTVVLSGVSIVCLFIDGKERLCLAQISNTLLKSYSYNEIHNRRVALGITCVQCTPVQLEILRRAGAMPISSRRCGMITKREAERLVKSFLEDTSPPKLPDNFAFDVLHECGWGCNGSFMPSRYNSSRAKCIKCSFCNMYFSPNKFIFHFHRTPESKYSHPDAANFNSWRRHLKLANTDSEDLFHCWEDVKAMFNGGSRKRVLSNCHSSSSSSSSRSHSSHKITPASERDPAKKIKLSEEASRPPASGNSTGTPYPQYPVFPMPNKFVPFRPPQSHPAFCMQPSYQPLNKALTATTNEPARMVKAPIGTWGGLPESMCPPYEMIWAKHLGLSPVENGMVLDPRMKSFPRPEGPSHRPPNPQQVTQYREPTENQPQDDIRTSEVQRLSAFRLVGNRSGLSPSTDNVSEYQKEHVSPPCRQLGQSDDSDSDEPVDVDTIDVEDRECGEENNNISTNKENLPQRSHLEDQTQQLIYPRDLFSINEIAKTPVSTEAPLDHVSCDVMHRCDSPLPSPVMSQHHSPRMSEPSPQSHVTDDDDDLRHQEPTADVAISPGPGSNTEAVAVLHDVRPTESVSDDIATPEAGDGGLQVLSREDLQKELMAEMQARRKVEQDCKTIKDTFQEQVEREKQFREEMAKQLQIVREKLCHELDQERQVRFSLQQKLKEANEALENVSGKVKSSIAPNTDV